MSRYPAFGLAVLLLASRAPIAASEPLPDAPMGLPVSLVADLASVTAWPLLYSAAPDFAELDGALLFFQDDGVYGSELWRTDGTALGTYRVRDICPGACSGGFDLGLAHLVVAGGFAFFAADDGVHGLELWVSDGTAGGTRMVRDIAPGRAASRPAHFVTADEQVLFLADDGASGYEIWRSDGTASGTQLFLDEHPGPESTSLTPIAAPCGFLFAGGPGAGGGQGLWRLDGNPAAPQLLLSGWTSAGGTVESGSFTLLSACRLVFSADTGTGIWHAWVSDGTPAGTLQLSASGAGSDPRNFVRFGNSVLFVGDDPEPPPFGTLWISGGAPGDLVAAPLPSGVRAVGHAGALAAAGTKVYFVAWSAATGMELGVWDGLGVTVPLDINPGSADALPVFDLQSAWNSGWLVAIGDRVVFPADEPDHGRELWVSDGSSAGTLRLTELLPGPQAASFDAFTQYVRPRILGERMLFRVWDESAGHRLWATDGTLAGTVAVSPLNTQTSAFFPLSSSRFPYEFLGSDCVVTAGTRVLFEVELEARWQRSFYGVAGDASGLELLATAPVEESFQPGGGCTPLGGEVLFFGVTASQGTLFASDGTTSGTEPLAGLGPVSQGGRYSTRPPLVPVGDRLVGIAMDQIVSSDGTPVGTTVESLVLQTQPTWAAGIGGLGLLGADELYVTDGTAAGTVVIDLDPDPDAWSYPEHLEPCLGGALFFATRSDVGRELWFSDGTELGTRLVADIQPGAASGQSSDFSWEDYWTNRDIVCLGERAIFAAEDGVHGSELWVSDGTAAGTAMIADLYFGSYPSRPRRLTRAGDRVYFVAESDFYGLEPFVTDGTAEGTRLVRDIAPGPASSVPQSLTAHGELVLFSAWTEPFGREVWRSDGTLEGTVRVTDLAPGPASSSPDRFTVLGERLFFAANDLVHGFELFTLADPVLAEVFRDGFESGSTSRWDVTLPNG